MYNSDMPPSGPYRAGFAKPEVEKTEEVMVDKKIPKGAIPWVVLAVVILEMPILWYWASIGALISCVAFVLIFLCIWRADKADAEYKTYYDEQSRKKSDMFIRDRIIRQAVQRHCAWDQGRLKSFLESESVSAKEAADIAQWIKSQ